MYFVTWFFLKLLHYPHHVEWVMVGVVVGVKNEKVVGVINWVEWVKNGEIFKIGGGNGGGDEIGNFHLFVIFSTIHIVWLFWFYCKIVTSLEIVLDIQSIYFDILLLRYKFFQSKNFPKTQKFLNPSEVLLNDFLRELSKDLLKNSKYASYVVLTTVLWFIFHIRWKFNQFLPQNLNLITKRNVNFLYEFKQKVTVIFAHHVSWRLIVR